MSNEQSVAPRPRLVTTCLASPPQLCHHVFMSLITAHRILIGTAIAFFLLYGALELRAYADLEQTGALLRAAVSFVVAAGWVLYFRNLKKR